MSTGTYKALLVSESGDGIFVRSVVRKTFDDLPCHDVLINVTYSALNYKDALSASGNKGVTKHYPHTPGVEAVGIVEESEAVGFVPGEKVAVGGYDFGMNTPGGFAEYARVPAEWVMKLPPGMDMRDTVTYGAAGFTAAMSVDRLERYGVLPESGDILVTGASGGVGSFAVALLAKAGYSVTAATGKSEAADFLTKLGARKIIPRKRTDDTTGWTLLRERWAGVVDTVGGTILATAIKSTKYGGVVTTCGNVAGGDLHTTVYPFILRGVSLVGIDSARCPTDERLRIWDRIANEWRLDSLDDIVTVCSLEDLGGYIDRILKGGITGRVVVDLSL